MNWILHIHMSPAQPSMVKIQTNVWMCARNCIKCHLKIRKKGFKLLE